MLAKLNRNIALIIFAVTIFGVCISYVLSFISISMAAQGFSATQIGISHSVNFSAILFAGYFLPLVVDKIGRRKAFLSAAIILVAALQFHYLASPNFAIMVFARVFTGIAIASVFIIIESWINIEVSDQHRGKTAGLYSGCLLFGFSSGTLILQFVPVEGYAPYLISSILSLSAFVPLYYVNENRTLINEADPTKFNLLKSFKLVPIIVIFGAVFGLSETSLMSLLPIYALKQQFDVSNAALLLTIFLIGGMTMQIPAGYLADRFSKLSILLTNSLLSILGAALLGAMGHENTIWLWVMMFIWGGAMLSIYPVLMAYIGENFNGAKLLEITVLLVMMYGVGSAIGPFLIGLLMDSFGPKGMTITIAAVWIISAISACLFKMRAAR